MAQSERAKTAISSPLSKPLSVDDLGISRSLLVDLALKVLYQEGEMDGSQIAEKLRLPVPVTVDLLDMLRKERLVTVLGSDQGVVPVYRYRITEAGIARAR
ncbi:MAG TPA: hypothetical protein ENO24_06440, partial [Chloroflexi bacterium]|nr:hypothetical protein [Chloroflexota bacterium]